MKIVRERPDGSVSRPVPANFDLARSDEMEERAGGLISAFYARLERRRENPLTFPLRLPGGAFAGKSAEETYRQAREQGGVT